MKLGFISVLFILGTLTYVTFAAPASSEIQQDDDSESEMTDKELIEVLKLIANQAKLGDKEPAQTELISNWGDILRIGSKILRHVFTPRRSPTSYYSAPSKYYHSYYRRGGYGNAEKQEKKELAKTEQFDAELQSRLTEILKDLITTKEKDEEVNQVQAQSEAVKELEDQLAGNEQAEEDRDALVTDTAMKADDSADLVGVSQDDVDDDDEDDEDDNDNEEDIEAELQRVKRRRRRQRIRNRYGCRRGYRRYRGRCRHVGRRRGNGGHRRGRYPGRRRTPSWLRELRSLPWGNIVNDLGSLVGGFVGNFLNQSPSGREKNEMELQQIDDDYDDTDDDDDVTQSEAINELENMLAAAQQFDDMKLQAQVLKTLIAANQY